MNVAFKKHKNNLKIKAYTKLLEAETKKKLVLESTQAPKIQNAEQLKKAVKTLAQVQMNAADALLLAQHIYDAVYIVKDVDLNSLFDEYGVEWNPGCGGLEDMLNDLGYVLRGSDIDKTLHDDYPGGDGELSSILCNLFYNGKSQHYVSDEFIKAVAERMKKSSYLTSVVSNALAGDEISQEGGPDEKGVYPLNMISNSIKHFYEKALPLVNVLVEKGIADPNMSTLSVRNKKRLPRQ